MTCLHRFSLGLALGFVLTAGGCGGSDQNGGVEPPAMAGSSAISAVKQKYADEIKSYESKIARLKRDATGVEDEKLAELTTSVDHKLIEIKGKLDSLKADQMQVDTLQADTTRLMRELKDLYEEATARLKLVKR